MPSGQIGPLQFVARTVVIRNVKANVRIESTRTQDAVTVILSGDHHIRGIEVSVQGDELVIDGQQLASQKQDTGSFNLWICVPLRTNLRLEEVAGTITVDDLDGDVSIVSDCYAPTFIGSVQNVSIKKSNTSPVDIQGVNGTLCVKNLGTNWVRVRGGLVTDLIVQADGTGSVYLNCPVQGDANISIDSTGSVQIDSGKIPNLLVRATSTGSFKFGGSVQKAKLFSTSTGTIDIAHCTERPVCTGYSAKKIRIQRVGK